MLSRAFRHADGKANGGRGPREEAAFAFSAAHLRPEAQQDLRPPEDATAPARGNEMGLSARLHGGVESK